MAMNPSVKNDLATRDFSLHNMSLKFSLLKTGDNKREKFYKWWKQHKNNVLNEDTLMSFQVIELKVINTLIKLRQKQEGGKP